MRKASIKAEWADKISFKEEDGYKFDSNVITPGTEYIGFSDKKCPYLNEESQKLP